MIEIMNGEALSICRKMKMYHQISEEMNLCDPEAQEFERIEGRFNQMVDSIARQANTCETAEDAICALSYIRDEFKGEDTIADALILEVIKWVRASNSNSTPGAKVS